MAAGLIVASQIIGGLGNISNGLFGYLSLDKQTKIAEIQANTSLTEAEKEIELQKIILENNSNNNAAELAQNNQLIVGSIIVVVIIGVFVLIGLNSKKK